MLSKKDQRSTIEAALCEEVLTIAGGHNLLLLHQQAHDRKSIAESLYAYLNRSRLTVCEVFIFCRGISHLLKVRPPSFEKLLKFIAHAWAYFGEIMV